MKHPLYYGVFIVEIGAMLTYCFAVYHKTHFIVWLAVGTISLAYAIGFNLLMMTKETERFHQITKKKCVPDET